MINLVNTLSSFFATQGVASKPVTPQNSNPFLNTRENIFLNFGSSNYENYAKNKPIQGGYFAGYYNNKPNIVGKRLFVEV